MPLDRSLAGKPGPPASFDYTWRDTVLYALGVGAKKEELDYLYEGRGPRVLPGFAVVPKFGPMLDQLVKTGGDLTSLVHGAERVRLHGVMPPAGRLVTTATIRDVYDLRRLAQVLVETRTTDESGKLLVETASAMLFRGEGGFGGEAPPKEPAPAERPEGVAPTFVIEEVTSREQALLYRLSGDRNPLHADPELAKAAGFAEGPILHGLCTLGFMVRHVARGACGGDATRIRGFAAQFRRPVWPGDTLVTEGWVTREGAAALRVKVKERDEAVLTGAWAEWV